MKPYALYITIPDPSTALTELTEVVQPLLISVFNHLGSISRQSTEILCLYTIVDTDCSWIDRAASYGQFQHLFSSIYSIVCSAGQQTETDLDFPGGLDVRVVLVTSDISILPQSGPVWLKSDLVSNLDHYQAVFVTSSSLAQEIEASDIKTEIIHIDAPFTLSSSQTVHSHASLDSVSTYTSVAVGGTFDHLHLGHKLLLSSTLFLADPSHPRTLTVGITGDALLVNKRHASALEPWHLRQQHCADFLTSLLSPSPTPPSTSGSSSHQKDQNEKVVIEIHRLDSSEISIRYACIQDPYGPTITDENIDALVVSAETRKGGEAVNLKRREKGWKELDVFEIAVLDPSVGVADDKFEGKISSTEIRKRIAEKTGRSS